MLTAKADAIGGSPETAKTVDGRSNVKLSKYDVESRKRTSEFHVVKDKVKLSPSCFYAGLSVCRLRCVEIAARQAP